MVATPSGITLAPEGGAHQSIAEPLIGLAQDGLATFKPAFVDELAVIMAWALTYIQKDSDAVPSEPTWLRDETGGSAYLRLSTRADRAGSACAHGAGDLAGDVVDGGLLPGAGPGRHCQVVGLAYTGRGRAGGHRRRRPDEPRTGATSASSPSPRLIGSTPAGPPPSAPASAALARAIAPTPSG